jgi:hypothetical protein
LNKPLRRVLGPEELLPYRSPYLNGGRAREAWVIREVTIVDDRLQASVMMSSTYVSATDASGFHLTIFSTLEFLSQLMIVYGHVRADLLRKTKEAWMVESHTRSTRAIRDPDDIRVDMVVRAMRRQGQTILCVTESRVTDGGDGLFEVMLKGFLS